jgi:violaxanthin de-epoxidase
VPKFDTKLFNGRWFISAGQNDLFDIFPCQVHFFKETAPGTFFANLNWRIEEPDGEYLSRDAVQRFVQDDKWPAHLINHDNEYLHYKDDWYVLDYEPDDNAAGVPPFALIYYRGSNDAWDGYGGAVVYTRDSKLPESLIPRLRESVKKVNFDWDKDFTVTDNTCKTLEKGEALILREKFAGKVAIQTEQQLLQQAVMARNLATKSISNEVNQVSKVVTEFEKSAAKFEDEVLKKAVAIEGNVVKNVVETEKKVVGNVVKFEGVVVKKVVETEKKVVETIEKDIESILPKRK